ncbi:Acetyltransferase (GNAT) domain-containing protein [Bacillus sp. 491mf]|uniref:GNAT family N-acetyltransferase n=1 Tax=Bacillus TaxID=1386 RepID=UPI00054D9365|nr:MULTISPECIES: GNAT family N-acetyltransferase [unclassified Bacillus (in: firmicutes)]SFC57180.1 Acetyltransferase (GNAT) domain-containing protein [Bacillus sp. 491mf]
MSQLYFIKDYKHNEALRKSYCELTNNIFGISFEEYYLKGFWNNRYIPFSYVHEDTVIANVSVNVLDLVIDGKNKKAIQIGTVMTHPNYRNQGLSAALMNKVLEEYDGTYDFIYLFANKNVLDFYPKFGFKAVNEYEFSMDFSLKESLNTNIHKLDITNIKDRHFIYEFATKRVPVSQIFSTKNAQHIFMFYCLHVFPHDIYYLEPEDVIVIFKRELEQIHIFDIVSKRGLEIQHILTKIADHSTKKIVFHYTPDYENIQIESSIFNGSEVLFVKSASNEDFPIHIKHPITSQA